MNCTLCRDVLPYKRLKIVRVLLNFKQLTFAEFMECSIPTLVKWENYDFRMSIEMREKLRHVGINPQWIDYGTGEPFTIDKHLVVKNVLDEMKKIKP